MAEPATPPSGRQHVIRHNDQEAIVVEVGGGLRDYRVDGRPVVDGYAEDAMCDGARGQSLMPWPNRVKDGAWRWRGVDRQLSLTEPSQHNAIHGLLRWAAWQPSEQTDASVTLAATCYPQPGYPWTLDVRNTWSLNDDGLSVTTRILNRSNESAPIAAGFHPYLTVGTDVIDDALLHLPVETWLPTDDQQIPIGREPVAGSAYDFREARRIADVKLDYTFTELQRDDNGKFHVTLSTHDGQRSVSLWLGAAYDFVEVFTGDSLPDEKRRRQGLGIEPMSAPPNALTTGESLVILEPGEVWTGEWGIISE